MLTKLDTDDTSENSREIFISYAWGGDSEALVDRLDQAFQASGISIIRDKRDLGYKGLIKEFMERIGRGKYIIAIINDKYLRSPNCMFELVQVSKNGDFYDRVFPIVLADAQIYRPTERIKYIKHWEDEINALDEAMRSVRAGNLQGFREEIDQYTEIRHTIARLIEILKNMNTLTPDTHRDSDFEILLKAIESKISEDNSEVAKAKEILREIKAGFPVLYEQQLEGLTRNSFSFNRLMSGIWEGKWISSSEPIEGDLRLNIYQIGSSIFGEAVLDNSILSIADKVLVVGKLNQAEVKAKFLIGPLQCSFTGSISDRDTEPVVSGEYKMAGYDFGSFNLRKVSSTPD